MPLARSESPTPAKIQTLVDDLVMKRLKEGQLDNCGITVRELKKVRKSFSDTLRSMLHSRIDYPKGEDDGSDPETSPKNGPSNGSKSLQVTNISKVEKGTSDRVSHPATSKRQRIKPHQAAKRNPELSVN